MRELIHFQDERGRLRCDNTQCGLVLEEGEVTWGEHLIGYECPACGSDMLTRQDFEASERMYRVVKWINKWFGWLGSEYSPDDPKWKAEVSIRHHDGETIIKREK